MDRREHHRAQLRLPVRIRWNTPFGQKTEICKTLDISRGGLLVPCQETHAPGVPLWVTFPYDNSVGDTQPEMLAKVVRVRLPNNGNGNGNKPWRVGLNEKALALHFALPVLSESNGNGHAREREWRDSPRRPVAIPVRVRLEHIPWFEEAMTVDISAHGLRFLSSREYQEGDRLRVSFEPTSPGPWPTGSETPARVVRIEPLPDSTALAVTVFREV
jgi:PilZ domain